MPRYIDVDKLLEYVERFTPTINGETTMQCVKTAIRYAPTADVVEVVRCKDCEFRVLTQNGYMCRINAVVTSDNGYCNYGKRKVQEVNNDVR